MANVVVSGAIANKYRSGGEAWVRLSWAMGLRRLGFDVFLVEQIASSSCTDRTGAPTPFASCVQGEYFRHVMRDFGFADRSTLVLADGDHATEGLSYAALSDLAGAAALLVNISGHLTLPSV